MKIVTARRRRGMTQEQVALAAGVSRGYLARLEAGQHSPTLATLARIAKALRMPIERLTRRGDIVEPDYKNARRSSPKMKGLARRRKRGGLE